MGVVTNVVTWMGIVENVLLEAHYRTIAIDYDLLLKTLRGNFTEKKAMAVLAILKRQTIELVKTNREIVALAKQFDDQWSQKLSFAKMLFHDNL